MDVKSRYVLVVLLSALIVAFESVAIEGALNISDLDVFLVSAIPSIVAGLTLVSLSPRRTIEFSRGLGRRGWGMMLALCLLVAAGVLMWFDAVGRIGAGKEALLGGGSSEILFVVILSSVFLSERLSKFEAVGGLMIVVGVFLVLVRPSDLTLSFGWGEAEAIASSLFLGSGVVLTTALLKEHDLLPLSGVELLVPGIIIFVAGTALKIISWPEPSGWILLVLLGLFPSVGLLTYNAGLPKIGASLTSVLFALNGILTVGAQQLVLLFFPDSNFIPPQSLALAVLGGSVAFAGVYLLNSRPANDTARDHGAPEKR